MQCSNYLGRYCRSGMERTQRQIDEEICAHKDQS
jgi:Arc/MetJ family transcription regulator